MFGIKGLSAQVCCCSLSCLAVSGVSGLGSSGIYVRGFAFCCSSGVLKRIRGGLLNSFATPIQP